MHLQPSQNAHITQKSQNILTSTQEKAIDLRLRGLRYYVIASILSRTGYAIHEDTIRHWFANGGACKKEYESRRISRLADLEEDLHNIEYQVMEGAVEAIAVIRNEIRKGNLKAAMDILDRAGYGKKTRVDVSTPDIQQLSEGISLLRKLLQDPKRT